MVPCVSCPAPHYRIYLNKGSLSLKFNDWLASELDSRFHLLVLGIQAYTARSSFLGGHRAPNSGSHAHTTSYRMSHLFSPYIGHFNKTLSIYLFSEVVCPI